MSAVHTGHQTQAGQPEHTSEDLMLLLTVNREVCKQVRAPAGLRVYCTCSNAHGNVYVEACIQIIRTKVNSQAAGLCSPESGHYLPGSAHE